MNWSQTLESSTLDYPITSLYSAQEKNKNSQQKFKHKTIKTRSLKKYTADNFCNKLYVNYVNFANYSEFDDINNAFVDFSDKLMQAVDRIAPYREFRLKGHTEDWFDGEIMERIKNTKNQNWKLTTKSIEKLNL